MLSIYNSILQRYPVPTEMTTSAILLLSGDAVAQYLERRSNSVKARSMQDNKKGEDAKQKEIIDAAAATTADWRRVGIQTFYAAFIWAPFGHYWYQWMDRAALSLATPGSIRFVGVKLALEMVFLHPVALFAFFASVGLMGGDKPRDIYQQLRMDFFPSLLLEYMLWTPIDVANFHFIPVRHQLLVVNTTCLVESIMLSYIKANEISLPGHDGEQAPDSSISPKKKE